jgi:chorismate mutase
MKYKKINIIRKKLDKLYLLMLNIIKKRNHLVNQILNEKKYKKQIVDRQRIKIILKKINKQSKKIKIDPKITNTIWKAMIKAFIDFEYRNFKKK